jgi:pentatricopeptide repeat protein
MKTQDKRFCFFLFFLCLALFIIGSAYGQVGFNMEERMMIEKYKRSNSKLEEGKALFENGNYEKAEKKLLECLKAFPQNANAHFFLAEIYYKKNDLAKALDSIENAKSNFQSMSKFYTFTYQEMLNTLRDQKSKLDEYIQKQEQALLNLRSQSQSSQVQSDVMRLENDVKFNKSQVSNINNRLNNPLPPVVDIPDEFFYIHGNILFKLKSYLEASNQYLETIKRNPKHNFAYNNLASIYFTAGDYQSALDWLKKAEENGVKVNPGFKKAVEEKLGKK